MCRTCDNLLCHVEINGSCLVGKNIQFLKDCFSTCSTVIPIHFIKQDADSFALLHFSSEISAISFWEMYNLPENQVCSRLKGLTISPLIKCGPAFWSQPLIFPSKRVICSCNTNTPSLLTSSDLYKQSSILPQTTAHFDHNHWTSFKKLYNNDLNLSNLTLVDNHDTTKEDDGREDIERAKIKIKNLIAKKGKELEELREKLRILEYLD